MVLSGYLYNYPSHSERSMHFQEMQKVLYLKNALELKKPKLQGEFLITAKIEGWFVKIHFDHKLGIWYAPTSSANRVIPSMAWSVELFNQLPKPKEDCFLIAEAYLEDLPFEIANGIFNRSIANCHCRDVVFKLHDIVFKSNVLTAYQRQAKLRELLEYCNAQQANHLHQLPILLAAPYHEVLWREQFENVVSNGGEGIVAKRTCALYSHGKRNTDLLKLKLECTVEALADRLEEGIGEQGFPSLTLISKRKNGTEIRTVIGRHEDQSKFRGNPYSIIGKVVQLKAMSEYEDGKLRQPVFQFIREDKLPSEID